MDAAVSPLRLARRQHQGLDYVRGLLTENNDGPDAQRGS